MHEAVLLILQRSSFSYAISEGDEKKGIFERFELYEIQLNIKSIWMRYV